jgi:hypothetical protein
MGLLKQGCFSLITLQKKIIGKSCGSVVSSVTNTMLIPPDLAAIVSLKFTFAVVYNDISFHDLDISFHDLDKEFLIKLIITAHGRAHSLPCSSTPRKPFSVPDPAVSPSTAMSKLSTHTSPTVSYVAYVSQKYIYQNM